jgi:diaminopimelate dehydrogenase
MMNIGIVGYGNLGKGVELSCSHNPDIHLSAIFTRRPKDEIFLSSNTPVIPVEEILSWKDRIDLMILCGGSATDLPVQGPDIAAHFNTVDSFDTHAKIPG